MKEKAKFLRYLADEREAGRMYRALAELTDGERRDALLELAEIEDRHASHWESLLKAQGIDIPPALPELDPASAQIVERARRLSLDAVLPELEAAEREAEGAYDNEPAALAGMASDERQHAEMLNELRSPAKPRGENASGPRTPADAREILNSAEPWHRTDKSGSLRAAIFGVSDGLVSNTALVMGFAGSGQSQGTVLFAGIAGLLAGAFSMAAGEYVSVASQRDIFQREIALEAQELKEKPLEEQRELELLYRAKGLDRETAKLVAARIISDPKTALDTLAREELGLDPNDLGSPYKVAAASFLAFAMGAAVPAIPYLFAGGTLALVVSIVMAVIALLLVGGIVGKLSGAGAVKSAIRQLVVGAGAAVVTYVIGRVIGGSLS